MENVNEIKELSTVDKVNEHLKGGWKLIAVNTHYPNHTARNYPSTPSALIYVVGR